MKNIQTRCHLSSKYVSQDILITYQSNDTACQNCYANYATPYNWNSGRAIHYITAAGRSPFPKPSYPRFLIKTLITAVDSSKLNQGLLIN